MLFSRPLLLLIALVLFVLGNVVPSAFGGFREPLAQRFRKPVACEQQVSQEQDFGVLRSKSTRRRSRC